MAVSIKVGEAFVIPPRLVTRWVADYWSAGLDKHGSEVGPASFQLVRDLMLAGF